MNPTPTELIVWILCFGAFATLVMKVQGMHEAIAKSIITRIKAEQSDDKKNGLPQPLIVTSPPKWLDLETYNADRKVNARKYDKLESEVRSLVTQGAAQGENQKLNGMRLEVIEKLVRDLPGEIIATITNSENLAAIRRKN